MTRGSFQRELKDLVRCHNCHCKGDLIWNAGSSEIQLVPLSDIIPNFSHYHDEKERSFNISKQ
jgi:hypothetical protein